MSGGAVAVMLVALWLKWGRPEAERRGVDGKRVVAAGKDVGVGGDGGKPGKEKVAGAPGRERVLSEADKLAAALEDQVVVTLGKVEDVGKQAGVMLGSKMELRALRQMDAAAMTAEQRRRLRELERQRAAVLGSLPEVAGFQNNPAEYASFFSNLLKEAAGLGAEQTQAVHDYMLARGAAMVAAGYHADAQPEDPAAADAWEEKRDVFNEETVAGVSGILPPGEAERIGFNDRFMELLEADFDKAGDAAQ